ncbi:hypothetical protein UFOVP965_40 [uncultured Caudovirales phage]|uniref:Uncharacterized protein n=1 Tax=uncultured Caudovirales phage TaxID=2100421 RepID=A0A6J5PWG4_9CAUD|nr:hypothetical protein UFOVP965_40 [uncultured Caudovirales phage]CAB4179759.1 hypothetical protein UFOVP1035_36 [uncultured Caudovirales phage]CAB4188875.1 hypothetical protein UFOVP1181_142 [uncultured Caudovirales phage]
MDTNEKHQYILIAGNGVTSRANLEALLEDHAYKFGIHWELVLPYKTRLSQGQMFALQFAKDKKRKITLWSTSAGDWVGEHDLLVNISEDYITDSLYHADKTQVSALILWDDEDTESVNIIVELDKLGIRSFDLTDGLNTIQVPDGVSRIEEPRMPPEEMVTNPHTEHHVADEEDDEEEEEPDAPEEESGDEDEEDDDDDDLMENLYYGIQALARIFAAEFLEALNSAPEKAPKGEKK